MRNLYHQIGSIYEVLVCFTDKDGYGTTADTSAQFLLYPQNSDAEITTGTFTAKDSIVGMYKYALNYGTLAMGAYTGVYSFVHQGTTFRDNELITIGTKTEDGTFTAAAGTAPARVGTVNTVNGTSGTTTWIMFTPTDALSYDVYRATQPFNTFGTVGNTTGGTYADNTVRDQEEYHYYVIGTNTSGKSLPSDIGYAFTYSQQFNYLNNSLQALQASMKAQLTDLNDVKIGRYDVMPEILPYAVIYQETDNEENVSVGYTGQLDKIYNINIRVYINGAGQNNETVEAKMTEYTGKVQSLLEALKSYAPYWYYSDITGTEYGEMTLDGIVLRFVDIKWTCKRRVLRSN